VKGLLRRKSSGQGIAQKVVGGPVINSGCVLN
jgi:hypothetical protein